MFTCDEVMPRRRVDVRRRIRAALGDGPLLWSQLLGKTGVSKGALSKHLKWLINMGIVKTRTEDSRPPTTAYYLADQRAVTLIASLTERIPEQEVSYFLQNILSQKVFNVLAEVHSKICTPALQPIGFKLGVGDFLSIRSWEEAEIQLGEDLRKFKDETEWRSISNEPLSISMGDLVGLDWENLSLDEQIAISESEFTPFTVQFILIIYQIERLILKVFPEELRVLMMEKADLGNTIVLASIQKEKVWREFDRFFEWWFMEVTPKLPSRIILVNLALKFWTSHMAALRDTTKNEEKS